MRPRTSAAALLPYAVFLLLSLVSWNRWLEPFVDSGRELMTPRRLAQGEALYRDVRFYHGPLGPYVAAAVELLAPRSLPARFFLAGLIALLHIEGLRRLAKRLLSPGRASLATALIVASAFFLRPGGCHLFPFSLDTSIAVAAITWALHLQDRGSRRDAWFLSGCLLAALLSRPEMGLAAIAALFLGKTRRVGSASPASGLAVSALLPLGIATLVYAVLSWGVPRDTLLSEGWLAFVKPPGAFRNIYASYAGLDLPGLRAAELLLAAIVLTAVAALLVTGAFLAARTPAPGRIVEAATLFLIAAAALVRYRPPEGYAERLSLFPPLIRVVPPLLILALCARVWRRLTRREDRGVFAGVSDPVLLIAALFSLRMLFVAGYFGPYNAFLLPLPLLVAITALFNAADRLVPAVGPSLPRLASGTLVILLLFRVGSLGDLFRHTAWSRVRTPAGELFLLEPVALATRQALADLSRRLRPGGTLAGFPEIGFLNYALGARNPLPQEQFFPGHLNRRAEVETMQRLATSPPSAIVYVNVLAVGHRSVAFGEDYLEELDRFVRSRFSPAAAYGPGAAFPHSPTPLKIGDPDFFIEIRVP